MIVSTLWGIPLWLLPTAWAGAGPWTLSPGDRSLYVGTETRRATQLANGSGALQPLPGGGVSTMGAIGSLSVGILPRLEGSLLLPAYRSRSLEPGAVACAELGLAACQTSSGVGTLSMRLKGLLLDELYGPPVSVALSAELRMGDLAAPTRARLTSLGEGTTDLGVFVTAGRSGGLGREGVWSAFAEGGWRYRFANAEITDIAVPGPEWLGSAEVLVGSSAQWMAGPVGYVLHRPQGFELESDAFSAAGLERFVGLRAAGVQAGGKLVLRAAPQWSVAISALHTLAAQNNFGDELVISVGLALWQPAPQAPLPSPPDASF